MAGFERVLTGAKHRGFNCRTFVDVGANMGDRSKAVWDMFPGATCYLLEPQPNLCEHLQKVVRGRPGAYLGVAVGRDDGTATLRYNGDTDNFEGGTCCIRDDANAQKFFHRSADVEMRSLDSLLQARRIEVPELLKLDVEGLELDVLRGATKFLGTVEMIMLETTLYPSFIQHPSFAEVVIFMNNHGYHVYDFGDLGYRPRDGALMIVDTVFVHHDSPLRAYPYWGYPDVEPA
jgi:FkbM family methyltransferase